MKSKVVENWLTNVTELTFTIPFCQLLLSKGMKVVHISSQGPMEQGKDIIAVDKRGGVHCYQLKCGNINGRVWGQIKSEIDELVELPPRHPSLSNGLTKWTAYLVTNGAIANPMSRGICDYAESKASRGYARLKTVVGHELVSEFTQYYDAFLPVDVVDLQEFLELYNQHGDCELDVAKLKLFFESYFASRGKDSRQKKAEAVRASLVLLNYILTNKLARRNHLEVIKAHILLLASIYEFAEAQRLPESLWSATEKLAYEALNLAFRELIEELKSHPRNYIETKYGVLSEVVAYKIRCTELLGYLSAYTNYCALAGIEPHSSTELESITAKLAQHCRLVGECVVPLFINRAIALRFQGQHEESSQELAGLLVGILSCHVGENRGMPSPYYDIRSSLDWLLGRSEIREGFKRRSYSLRTVILLLARYGLRDLLASHWSTISRISQQEVIPKNAKDYLIWRFEEGDLADRFSNATQSWAQLVAESAQDYSGSLPGVLSKRRHFLPLLINVMPQRLSHRLALTILDVGR